MARGKNKSEGLNCAITLTVIYTLIIKLNIFIKRRQWLCKNYVSLSLSHLTRKCILTTINIQVRYRVVNIINNRYRTENGNDGQGVCTVWLTQFTVD